MGRALSLRSEGRLKRRGYRWSDGSDGRLRSWYIDVEEIKLEAEIAFLKNEIFYSMALKFIGTLFTFQRLWTATINSS
jgi:DNA polymerase III subunit epsilon